MSHLLPARPDVRLLLPGGGRTDVELKAEIADWPWEKVVMSGRVPHERIPAIYALCDILPIRAPLGA